MSDTHTAPLEVVDGGAPKLNRDHVINLQGRNYAQYAGVLDLATKAGIRSLETTLVQIPTAENNGVAIVQAILVMEDGRTFTDYGDAGPSSLKPNLIPHAIRFASTRAKGRVLRDACNIGETLAEEFGDDAPQQRPPQQRQQQQAYRGTAETPAGTVDTRTGEIVKPTGSTPCEARRCEAVLTPGQYTVSMAKFKRPLCPAHQRIAEAQGEKPPAEPAPADAASRVTVEAAVYALLHEMDTEGYGLGSLGLTDDSPLLKWLMSSPDDFADTPMGDLTLAELKIRGKALKEAVARAREAAKR